MKAVPPGVIYVVTGIAAKDTVDSIMGGMIAVGLAETSFDQFDTPLVP